MKFNRFLLLMISILLCTVSIAKTGGLTEVNRLSPDSKQEALIPISQFFNDPQYAKPQISPDGKHLAYLSPHQGVLNVWIGSVDNKNSIKPITQNTKRSVFDYYWAYNNEHIIYVDDNEGDENWRIHRVNINDGTISNLATFNKVQVRIMATSPDFPDEILIGINQRRGDFHDIYRLNIRDGQMSLVYENNTFYHFIMDDHLNVKIGIEQTADGGVQVSTLDKAFVKTDLYKIEEEDALASKPMSLNKAGDQLYILDSQGRNTAALTLMDLKTKKRSLIAENDKADVYSVLFHRTEKTVLAYTTNYEKPSWVVQDKSVQQDMDYLHQLDEGIINTISSDLDSKVWVVSYMHNNKPMRYYLYDRVKKKAEFLFSAKPELNNLNLSSRQPVMIESRDHLSLVSYLSVPNSHAVENGVTQRRVYAKSPLPMVLLVHGGPHARDEWGFNEIHQWLSNRGYAVLSVNYRGSSGFGKKFYQASKGEWGQKMHDDLIDAVEWAIANGVTTREKVAIMGGSFGGYATLVGMTKTPDVFACGIDLVGISNLETFMKTIPEYWKPFYPAMTLDIGGSPETEEGRKFLASRSPVHFVQNIKKPLLIGQGANDPRVKQAESEQMVHKMQENHIPVTYVLYPDEGHGFKRFENRLSFYRISEIFLAKSLGGRNETVENIREELKNSSYDIKVGKEYIAEF